MNSVLTYIKANKVKTILGLCALSSLIYYGKKNYTKIKNIYELTKEFINCMKNSKDNLQKQVLEKTQSDKKLNAFVLDLIDKELKISETKDLIAHSKGQELIENWEILKEKIIISFFASFFLLKYLTIISLTNISLLNVFINSNKITVRHAYELINILWEISNRTSSLILKRIVSLIQEEITKIKIKESFSFEKIENLLKKIYNNMTKINEETGTLDIFISYEKEIGNKIDKLEMNDYDPTNSKNEEIDGDILFFSTYFDIISSNLIIAVLYNTFQKDLEKNIGQLKARLTKAENTLAKIVLQLDAIKLEMMDSEIVFDNNINEYLSIISKIQF